VIAGNDVVIKNSSPLVTSTGPGNSACVLRLAMVSVR
jgi:hypothetical protein